MFRLDWIRHWGRPRRAPDAAANAARASANASMPVAAPARERPAALLQTLALAGNEYLAEEEVDRATLGELFARAFIRVSYDQDGDLWAQECDAPRAMVTVDLVRRMIRIAAAWRFKQESDAEARQRLAARANNALWIVRFRVVEPQSFLAEYYLCFEKGLLAAQLVHSLKLFGRVTLSAIREHDREDVLQ
jgi:hypothetical protein